MPTVIKQRIHLALIADLTKLHLFIRNLKHHRALAMPFPFLKAPGVYVTGFAVGHLALAVGFVGGPGAGVGVAVGVAHCAVAGFLAGCKGAVVVVPGKSDEGAEAVGEAVFEGAGAVGASEVGVCEGVAEEGWVVEAAQVVEVFDGGGWFAFVLKRCSPKDWFSNCHC